MKSSWHSASDKTGQKVCSSQYNVQGRPDTSCTSGKSKVRFHVRTANPTVLVALNFLTKPVSKNKTKQTLRQVKTLCLNKWVFGPTSFFQACTASSRVQGQEDTARIRDRGGGWSRSACCSPFCRARYPMSFLASVLLEGSFC